jgi:predicted  nucleic acid-binding Zn-ribbon protein
MRELQREIDRIAEQNGVRRQQPPIPPAHAQESSRSFTTVVERRDSWEAERPSSYSGSDLTDEQTSESTDLGRRRKSRSNPDRDAQASLAAAADSDRRNRNFDPRAETTSPAWQSRGERGASPRKAERPVEVQRETEPPRMHSVEFGDPPVPRALFNEHINHSHAQLQRLLQNMTWQREKTEAQFQQHEKEMWRLTQLVRKCLTQNSETSYELQQIQSQRAETGKEIERMNERLAPFEDVASKIQNTLEYCRRNEMNICTLTEAVRQSKRENSETRPAIQEIQSQSVETRHHMQQMNERLAALEVANRRLVLTVNDLRDQVGEMKGSLTRVRDNQDVLWERYAALAGTLREGFDRIRPPFAGASKGMETFLGGLTWMRDTLIGEATAPLEAPSRPHPRSDRRSVETSGH